MAGEKRLSPAAGAQALEGGVAVTGERPGPSRLAGEDHELSAGGARVLGEVPTEPADEGWARRGAGALLASWWTCSPHGERSCVVVASSLGPGTWGTWRARWGSAGRGEPREAGGQGPVGLVLGWLGTAGLQVEGRAHSRGVCGVLTVLWFW